MNSTQQLDDDAPESLRAATSFCAGGRAVDVPAPSRAREGQDDRTTAEWIADLIRARQVAEAEAEQLRAKVARVEEVIGEWWPLNLPDFGSSDAHDEIRAALADPIPDGHGPDFTCTNHCLCGAVIHDESQFRAHIAALADPAPVEQHDDEARCMCAGLDAEVSGQLVHVKCPVHARPAINDEAGR